MKSHQKKHLLSIISFVLFMVSVAVSQTADSQISAGEDRYVNWDETHTVRLNGQIPSGYKVIQWLCPANPEVTFDNTSGPVTEVTFPRPGYYLLELKATTKASKNIKDSVIINVFKPGSFEQRLNDLIGLMTTDEKIGQLTNEAEAIPRLGISAYNYWSEALHGILDEGTTSFPQAIAMGATWDPELVYRIGSAISDEARVKHITEGKGLSYWSPTVNIARDPRWGRNEESYSEDPYLLSRMGISFVQGMQGDHPYYLKTLATPKHFIANNEETRRHSGSSDVDMRSLWEYYMPAFERTIIEGKAFSIMGAYNELNHVPCCGNQYLMNDVLRRKWGFNGYVVSDCGAIHDMVSGHHFFETGAEAAARGILSGCDLNCGRYYSLYLHEAIELGLIEEKDLDRAVYRVLSARFRLGEFDPEEMVPYSDIPENKLDCKEHRDLALKTAHKSIVLLKNDGILPLDKKKIKTIAVIGPNAAECQLGIYSGFPNIMVSPLEGIEKKASKYGIKIRYGKGCTIGGGLLKPIDTKYFAPVDDSGIKGMKGEYYDNMNLEGMPVYTRIDTMIDFSWGGGPPAPGLPADFFSVRWTGKIIPPETRVFGLGTRTDDGARLYFNGEMVLEDWTEHGEKPNNTLVELEAGKTYEIIFEYYDNILGSAARLTWDLGQKDYEQAKEVARNSDMVVLVLGTSPGLSEEELDRTDISLPIEQRELIREVATVNPNIVVVLINGGPVALLESEKYTRAVVEAWYTGQSSGTAIADVLFGDVNPGGKLPETFYASTEQLPSFSDYDIINNPRTYMYFDQPVLYPFGHGLSYTTFAYSGLKLSSEEIPANGEITVECTVKNTGHMKGDEVVQIYYRDSTASVKVPIRKLVRFERISLEPGESKKVSFRINAHELAFYDIESNDFMVETGEFEIQAGSSSQDIRLRKTFVVK